MIDLRMPDINSVLIAGNLTRDPVFRKTTNGTSVANFWIASNRKFKDNNGQWRENVCYVGVVAWYKLAENCAGNLHKGNAVLIEGELQSRSFRTDDGRNRNIVEIKARRVQFLNKKEDVIEEERDIREHDEPKLSAPSIDSFKQSQTLEEKQVEQAEEIDTGDSLEGEYDFGYQNLQL